MPIRNIKILNATNIYLKTETRSVILRELTSLTIWSVLEDSYISLSWANHQQTTTDPQSSSCQAGEKMASFTSTFSSPALLNSTRSHQAIPKHSHSRCKMAFPRLSKPLLHFKRIYSSGRKLERATWSQIPVPHQAGISDPFKWLFLCPEVRREQGQTYPNHRWKHLFNPQRFFHLLAAGMLLY